jgi:CRP-like cAMP-binding protein
MKDIQGLTKTGNRFLDALPTDVLRRCIASATLQTFAPGHVVARRRDRLADVVFPTQGAVSEIEEGLDGGSAEVTVVGFEGVSGLEGLLDFEAEPFLRMIEVPTTAIVSPVGAIRTVRDEAPSLHRLIHRYAAARLQAAGISIACNARHDAPSRLARWLLRMADRAGHGDFELTHETIALMVGVRRETVTRAIHELVAADAIVSERHAVHITDRAKLEALTCSCYPEARDVFDHVYGDRTRATDI